MAKNSEKILEAYEQANEDASEILSYINSISNPRELMYSSLPSLVKNLESKNSQVASKYIDCAAIVGGPVAAIVNRSITAGELITYKSAVSGGILGALAVSGMFFWPVSFLTIPTAITLIVSPKIKKYIKDNQIKMKQKMTELQKAKEKLNSWFNDLQDNMKDIDEKMREEMHEKFVEYKDKTKELAKDISIKINDCVNTNTNKRIMQYNEVILKQYALQKDLEDKVDFMFDKYNELLNEKQELEEQISRLISLLNALGCAESVINHALNGEG